MLFQQIAMAFDDVFLAPQLKSRAVAFAFVVGNAVILQSGEQIEYRLQYRRRFHRFKLRFGGFRILSQVQIDVHVNVDVAVLDCSRAVARSFDLARVDVRRRVLYRVFHSVRVRIFRRFRQVSRRRVDF